MTTTTHYDTLEPLIDAAQAAYDSATGDWTGLSWTDLIGRSQQIDASDYEYTNWDNEAEVAAARARIAAQVEGDEDEDADDLMQEIKERVLRVKMEAAEAEEEAAKAMAAIEEGRYEDAASSARAAASIESEYGDDPTWGAFAARCRELRDRADELHADVVNCQCGKVIGQACEWSGPKSETVIIEYMPEFLRGSHEAAGNSGRYPANGAERLRVERSCAALIVGTEGEWASIVEVAR